MERVSCILHCKSPVDNGPQLILGYSAVHILEHIVVANIDPLDTQSFSHKTPRVDATLGQCTDVSDRAGNPGRGDRPFHGTGSADLDHMIDAAALADIHNRILPFGRIGVSDRLPSAELRQACAFFVAGRCVYDPRAQHLGKLKGED